MGLTTAASIEISAPRDEVFRWLIEPEKLTAWMGGAGAMPEDPAQLRVGFTAQGTMPAPEGTRATTLTVTAWNPPSVFGCSIAYPGGDSNSTYTLEQTATGTRLTLASDTDWAQMDMSGLDKALESQPAETRDLVEDQIEAMVARFAGGAFDGPTQAAMQKSVEGSLATLKSLIEKA